MPQARLVWKTTTATKRVTRQKPDHAVRIFPEVFDAAALTKCCAATLLLPQQQFGRNSTLCAGTAVDRAQGQCKSNQFVDNVHFWPPMYTALARARLETLYGPPGRCAWFLYGQCWVFHNATGHNA